MFRVKLHRIEVPETAPCHVYLKHACVFQFHVLFSEQKTIFIDAEMVIKSREIKFK